jgi:hypothetical protein
MCTAWPARLFTDSTPQLAFYCSYNFITLIDSVTLVGHAFRLHHRFRPSSGSLLRWAHRKRESAAW